MSQLLNKFHGHFATPLEYVISVTRWSLEVGSSYLHIRCIFRQHRSGSYMKIIVSRAKSKKGLKKSLFPQNSLDHDSSSIKRRTMKFACSMGFSAMADRMVWPPSLSRGRKWTRVSNCMHLWLVGLRLDGHRVFFVILFVLFSTRQRCVFVCYFRSSVVYGTCCLSGKQYTIVFLRFCKQVCMDKPRNCQLHFCSSPSSTSKFIAHI